MHAATRKARNGPLPGRGGFSPGWPTKGGIAARARTSFPPGYFGNCRRDLIELARPQPHWRALEVGCGEGATGDYLLRHGLVREVVGVEIVPGAASKARSRLSQVLVEDVEELDFNGLGPFDLVLCGDVLEHMADPWATVHRLAAALKPAGVLVASLPNVRHRSVVRPLLLRGRWLYQEVGVLDRGHLRFFTREGARALFEEAGLHVEVITHDPLSFTRKLRAWLTLGWAHDFYVHQFKLRASKPLPGAS